MMNKDKIKSAAQGYCDATYGTLNEHPLVEEAFKEGANWAINEFLKNLWHPVWKVPEDNRYILLEEKYSGIMSIMFYLCYNEPWYSRVASLNITRWLYINDLLPKKGGKQ